MKARETYLKTLTGVDLAALYADYEAWRKEAGEAEIVESHYQTDGATHYLLIFYTE